MLRPEFSPAKRPSFYMVARAVYFNCAVVFAGGSPMRWRFRSKL